LAFEQLNPIRTAARGVTLFSATVLVGLLAHVSLRVFRAGQWPPPGWRVVYNMSIRTGRQASMVAMFFLLLAVAVIAYGVLLVSLPGPMPEEQREVPMKSV
jgi:hypothetical protein